MTSVWHRYSACFFFYRSSVEDDIDALNAELFFADQFLSKYCQTCPKGSPMGGTENGYLRQVFP